MNLLNGVQMRTRVNGPFLAQPEHRVCGISCAVISMWLSKLKGPERFSQKTLEIISPCRGFPYDDY